ncbi:hypothetical protein EST92_04165 [Streptomyces sp. TM32]|nr:hypothetical protein EST92_04165 [Streptomyces sp. TM32]
MTCWARFPGACWRDHPGRVPRIRAERIRAEWPAVTGAASRGRRDGEGSLPALSRACPLVICNELFLPETARHADVVLLPNLERTSAPLRRHVAVTGMCVLPHRGRSYSKGKCLQKGKCL